MSEARRLLGAAVLVTANSDKVSEARRICGFDIPHEPLDLPEVQGMDLHDILERKGEEAWRRLGRPVVVEETGLELAALHGFPGPLVKWMLAAVGADGIARTALALGNPRAVAHCALLYRDDDRVVVGDGWTTGSLVLPPRGFSGFGWDPVFLPEGETGTYAELEADRKDAIGHRGKAWRRLIAELRALSPPPSAEA